jgi:serine/threonine-protein kinase
VVFNANRQLWLRSIDDLVATPIRGTDQARVPFFSPDGQQLGFWGGDGQMKSVSIPGGAPVSLGPAPEWAYGASWAEDGYIYFGQGAGGISRVSENGGEPQVVVRMEEGEQAHGPELLPGGEWLLFTLRSGSGSWNAASIVAQPVSGGERKLLVAEGTDGRYVPTGHIVYALGGDLFVVPFDAGNVEVTGSSVSIVEGVQQAPSVTGAGQYAFSDRGGLVYMPGDASSVYQLVWLNRNGHIEPLPFEPSSSSNLDLSPDDQRIALEIQGDDGVWDIWIYEVGRGSRRTLLTTEGNNQYPVWSPDGEWVFFMSDRGGDFNLWKRRADHSFAAELVLERGAPVRPRSISADGEMLLFDTGVFPNSDVGILALDGDEEPEMLVATAADEAEGSFSPDGRFFAFMTNETGQFEVSVQEVSNGRTFSVSTSARGGDVPRWSRDGREIYYRSRRGPGILVAEVSIERFFAATPVKLSDIVMRRFVNFDVTADGQRFLVTVPVGTRDTGDTAPGARINVVLNWFEELKQRVSTTTSAPR